MDFQKTVFVKSAPTVGDAPYPKKREVLLMGRSNVGKSSLINALTNQKLAHSSKKAGKTVFLNYFLVDSSIYLVDSPGYGYTSYGHRLDDSFSEMMEGYFKSNRKGMALLLVDSRRGLKDEERELIALLKEEDMGHAIVFTKADTLKQSEMAALKKEVATLDDTDVLFSYADGRSVNEIRGYIARRIKDVRCLD